MPITATNRYKRLTCLTPQQELAVELLVAGATDQEVANELGVHRVTVTRWRLYHPAVQAAINQQRKDLRTVQQQRLEALTSKALDALDEELDKPGVFRARLALQVLRLQVSHESRESVESIGPTDPNFIIDVAAYAREQRVLSNGAGPIDRGGAIDEIYEQAIDSSEDKRSD
jgi:hypothetical protein